jgi:hypothetical protein
VAWNGLAQVRYQWMALMNEVMNLRVSQNAGNFLSGLSSTAQPHRVSSNSGSYEEFCLSTDVTEESVKSRSTFQKNMSLHF